MFFSLFIINLLGKWSRNKKTDGLDKISEYYELSKNNMARYIPSQVMFQQQDIFLLTNFLFN